MEVRHYAIMRGNIFHALKNFRNGFEGKRGGSEEIKMGGAQQSTNLTWRFVVAFREFRTSVLGFFRRVYTEQLVTDGCKWQVACLSQTLSGELPDYTEYGVLRRLVRAPISQLPTPIPHALFRLVV